MKHFELYEADQVDQLVRPENFQMIDGDSSAKLVFTDFTEHEPLVIDANSSAIAAERLMKQSHVRLMLVLNEHEVFVGVIAYEDLHPSEIIKKVANGFNRAELQVADMMRKRQDLKVFDYSDLTLMTVSNVLDVLKQFGHQHCLVVEREQHQIRGVISASDIARKLKMEVCIQSPTKFTELYLSSLHR
ncbi:Uncharacterised protein [Zhongshania aliphaticivorans]|uniref:CBS domain-containing protein n=1 Tax=Zhongshania aliphaticivorans TaxID=1470434 RepID=A0A5S9NNY7_9GAMM|nr:CBS domain-containing protein [Zhongshania aliphaticivorans]CAA0092087.1 Uncharacterised protein [Zhongshania aliphaticivorans]CAA0099415.1 Uncharacterised protein [Zhongshania aliphaticivorans]